ncbi:MAG: Uma2 family endonuclease [Dehalococcoidia bacterium]|nr:Uma2 family endonuclease [Dehalococcoidia bacterium]
MTTQKTLITAEQLLAMPTGMGERYELIAGELITMPPSGGQHGVSSVAVAHAIKSFVLANRIPGVVFGAETGFWLHHGPDTVRAPDAAFVRAERFARGPVPAGFVEGAPELVVEAVSPSDTAAEVQAKTEAWLDAGAELVWLLYPQTRSVTAFKSRSDIRVLSGADTLTGEPVLPGFSVAVADLFR